MRFSLPLIASLVLSPVLARRYTTTVGGEVVLATVWTTAGVVTTSIYQTVDAAETVNPATQTAFTPSGTISIDTTDTYYAPKPTRIATLGSYAPPANSNRANITVTRATVQVPSGTRMDLGAFQASLATQTPQSGGALSPAPAAGLALAGAAVYALV
ncbi:hypothetical protein CC85DRAFT_325325 [Cutaneotrichosporon oleaginosum]|uniref:Uncharacterized protein n=1 Tax=Cutaneotrichosporon oleaginosum TaxID=879819 RepID=A0A0J0XWZ4_9TREE|nr:uncharacterized protein CC85DRAFT_325325 [Cutaneotrichosporon oleaginosum]KLT45587.1 hypothetical protein CC85DRAFT_325325 [Cutaneotrichosporon oleaginosum]TXT04616.1 hypothetical protein COLE_07435 [Cutaneotrichosporon oleaginosum]